MRKLSHAGLARIDVARYQIKEFRPVMEKLLASKDSDERRLGRSMLAHYDPDRLFKMLTGYLENAPATIDWQTVLIQLLETNKPEAVDLVLQYQNDSLHGETLAIIEKLGQMREKRLGPMAVRKFVNRSGRRDNSILVPALLRADPKRYLDVLRSNIFYVHEFEDKLAVLRLLETESGRNALPALLDHVESTTQPQYLKAEIRAAIQRLRK